MDAPPPPVADPPAYLAPAPDLPRGMQNTFSMRAGLGIGGSSYGPGGAYFAQADGWLSRSFGLGLEGEMAGASKFELFEKPDKETYGAFRARASLRFPVGPRAIFSTALGFGVATVTTNHAVPGPPGCDTCDEGWFDDSSVYVTHDETSPTGSLELALRYQRTSFEAGAMLRLEAASGGVLIIAGPTFGFGL